MNQPLDTAAQAKRNRAMLLLLAVAFLGSFALAGVLRFSGWRPEGMRNKGELLQPPGDLRHVPITLVDGGSYAWNPVERDWRILVDGPARCDAACQRVGEQMAVVWTILNKDSLRVHVLWLGEPAKAAQALPTLRTLQPTPAIRAQLPRGSDGHAPVVYVIDPNGFVILRYAPGFDPGDLRTDLARLLKLK